MKSVVFFNNKGGVGKTTLLCNLAAFLSVERRKKVLVVDADPQCNTTTYMLIDEEVDALYQKVRRPTIESFLAPLRRGQGFASRAISPKKSTGFRCDLIPGDPRLALSEDLLAGDWKSATSGDPRGLQTTMAFRHMTMQYRQYDYVFLDVGPSLGAINRSVLLAADYFLVPMAVDVFSLMALENINLSLEHWKAGLEDGLKAYERQEREPYAIEDEAVNWKLLFAGYVMQQYKAKTVRGEKVHVNAFERISKHIPNRIHDEISSVYYDPGAPAIVELLGEVENLHSLVPMSQTAKFPIFLLKAKHGVVGAHFARVADSKTIYARIADNLLCNLGDEDD